MIAIEFGIRPTMQASVRGWTLAAAALLASALTAPAMAAERDICENKSGQELIRCIEAAARGAPPPAAPSPTPAPGKAAPTAAPTAPAKVASPSAPRPQSVPEPARPAPEDCTGKAGETLRRCLAAGGRLAPEAAVTSSSTPQTAPTAAAPRQESCDSKSGEELRRCVEAAAKAPQPTPSVGVAQPQVISCTGYSAADQPLCLHRNTALVECRNRQKYPDFDVCLRSFMVRAPQPTRADCSALQARSRAHCENRNQAFQGCLADKMTYFACLEQKLGTDARLTKR